MMATSFETKPTTRSVSAFVLLPLRCGILTILGFPYLCQPVLRGLANKTGELIQLAIVQNEQMIYVAKAEGQQRIRVLSLVGRTAVLHASSAGKVWLASLPENQAFGLALRQGLTRYTDKTISNIDQLRTELHRARKNGYALVEEEMFQGASAVAAPIFDRQHTRVLGAIILSGPTYRLPKKRMLSFVACLKKAADKLTELGNIDVHFGERSTTNPLQGRQMRARLPAFDRLRTGKLRPIL